MGDAGQHIRPADDEAIADAAGVLAAGGLVVFPTETVYGLGGDATNDNAVAAIFAAKDRPEFNPLIVHVPDADSAAEFVTITPLGRRLIDAFWPGPLTLVLPRRADCRLSRLVSAGLDTIAIRVPAHPVGRALLQRCGLPIAAPSANRSGHLSPTQAVHAASSLPGPGDGGPKIILDAGACTVGLESTVVDATGDQAVILRPGGITADDVSGIAGAVLQADADDADRPKSPGMLARHYAPGKPLRLDALAAQDGEVLLGFGPDAPDGCTNLSQQGDTAEAAANLFAMLHELDTGPASGIAVMSVPAYGLGQAINDRLTRAANSTDMKKDMA